MAIRRARVLVVEDDQGMREIIRGSLLRRGYHAETAPSGNEGLEAIRTMPPFDLAILDVRLPGLSGTQLLRYLETESPGTEVVVISGYTTEELRVDSVTHGAFAILQKPFLIGDLMNLVDRLLQSRSTAA